MKKKFAEQRAQQVTTQAKLLGGDGQKVAIEQRYSSSFAEAYATLLPFVIELEDEKGRPSGEVTLGITGINGEDFVRVIKSTDKSLRQGLQVSVPELRYLVGRNLEYRPKMGGGDSETAKKTLFDLLTELVHEEGGDNGFALKVTEIRLVKSLEKGVETGRFSSNVLALFDKNKSMDVAVQKDGKWFLLSSGYRQTSGKSRRERFAIELRGAPNGIPEGFSFREGIFIPVADLFRQDRLPFSVDFARFLIALLHEDQEEVMKELVSNVVQSESGVMAKSVFTLKQGTPSVMAPAPDTVQ